MGFFYSDMNFIAEIEAFDRSIDRSRERERERERERIVVVINNNIVTINCLLLLRG